MGSVPRYQAMPNFCARTTCTTENVTSAEALTRFETKAQAESCFSAEFFKAVTAAYGKLEISYFEYADSRRQREQVVNEAVCEGSAAL